MIESVKNDEGTPVVAQPTAMNRTMGGSARPSHHLMYSSTGGNMMASPRTAISKHAMDFVQSYGMTSPNSTLPPEIALRDPLEQEFALNRKMAKKLYQRQLHDRMLNNKAMN